jgi:hypothetical protein
MICRVIPAGDITRPGVSLLILLLRQFTALGRVNKGVQQRSSTTYAKDAKIARHSSIDGSA